MTVPVPKATTVLVVLVCFWLLLSGYLKPLLLIFGAVSCLFVAWLWTREHRVDDQNVALRLHWGRWLAYTVWLFGQIIKSAIDVSRRILDPKLPISPTVAQVPAELSDVGKVIYANSITLTPGTVSINLSNNQIVVHALTHETMDDLEAGEMYRRVRRLDKQASR